MTGGLTERLTGRRAGWHLPSLSFTLAVLLAAVSDAAGWAEGP